MFCFEACHEGGAAGGKGTETTPKYWAGVTATEEATAFLLQEPSKVVELRPSDKSFESDGLVCKDCLKIATSRFLLGPTFLALSELVFKTGATVREKNDSHR